MLVLASVTDQLWTLASIAVGAIERAERWFEPWGGFAVFFSRMLPIVRTFISLPAGAARMPFKRFTLFTFLGCVPWVFMLAFVGKQVGDNWHSWRHSLEYADYVI